MQVGLERKEGSYTSLHTPQDRRDGVGVTAKEDHDYIVVGDPGQGSPPNRNSGVVMAFDVTGSLPARHPGSFLVDRRQGLLLAVDLPTRRLSQTLQTAVHRL
jgi:hypothetical protein